MVTVCVLSSTNTCFPSQLGRQTRYIIIWEASIVNPSLDTSPPCTLNKPHPKSDVLRYQDVTSNMDVHKIFLHLSMILIWVCTLINGSWVEQGKESELSQI
jgi:hypothetical protein